MFLEIDSRERQVHEYANSYFESVDKSKNYIGINSVTVKTLAIADYIIRDSNEKIVIAVERKTWADLAASIRDGRKFNVNKLIKLREQCSNEGHTCCLIYIIEGVIYPNWNKRIGRVPGIALRSHLHHLMMRDNIHIKHSNNIQETVKILFELARDFATLTATETMLVGGNESSSTLVNTGIKHTDDYYIMQVWCSISGINASNLHKIKSVTSLQQLLCGEADESAIAELQYDNGRRFGKKKASIIVKSGKYDHKRILASIPSVSANTAAIILTVMNITDIINRKYTVDDIKAVVLSRKVDKKGNIVDIKINQRTATNIIKFLTVTP